MDDEMKYKVSTDIKLTFLCSIGLGIIGLVTGNTPVVLTSILIFVVLSSTIHILEAIHDARN
jgi:hypothetical protein